MKALILVGGYGTRLRPLTITQPKPLVELCNIAVVERQVIALRGAGVTTVVLAVSFQPAALVEWAEGAKARLGVDVILSEEDPKNPLGTAGPIGLARKILDTGEPFFVLNSDNSCSFPLKEMLAFHRSRPEAHRAEGTILVTRVQDPSMFGVVVYDKETGAIDRFVEKPKVFVGDMINAGIYILEPSVFDLIEPRRMSIEREVFPRVAQRKTLYAFELEGFWADVGQPKDFIKGTQLLLDWLASDGNKDEKTRREVLDAEERAKAEGWTVVSPCMVHPGATVAKGAVIGPHTVLGPDCSVGEHSLVRNTTLLPGSSVGKASFVNGTIVGWRSSIGNWCRVQPGTVLGEDVHVGNELLVNGALVLPFKNVNANVEHPEIIM